MRTKSMKVYKRRLKVKHLYLKEMSIHDIADELGVSESVVRADIRAINK